MKSACPECSAEIASSFEGCELVVLKIKCRACGKTLTATGASSSFEHADRADRMDTLRSLAAVAWADGAVTKEERSEIRERAKVLDIAEGLVEDIIQSMALSRVSVQPLLHVAHTEDIRAYLVEGGNFYDVNAFAELGSRFTPEHPDLKTFREQILHMLESNENECISKARFFERLYNDSTLETEWREYRGRMDQCFRAAEACKELRTGLESLGRADFIAQVNGLATSSDDEWG